MNSAPIRPHEGSQITVLISVSGHPITHVARAGRVTPTTLIVPRKREERRWGVEPQGEADVLFVHEGRIYRWPMRVEEVLPTSYYLVSLQDPRDGERREFVRARAEMELRLTPLGQARGRFETTLVEISASGLRVSTDLPANAGDLFDVSLRLDGNSEGRAGAVSGRAHVVRVLHGAEGRQLALEFVELPSADEDRLLQLVFRLREAALLDRIGRRGFA